MQMLGRNLVKVLVGIDHAERATERHSIDVRSHEIRVARLASGLAREIGLPPMEQRRAFLAGRFHDAGKLEVDADVLFKNGTFTPDERSQITRHAVLGLKAIDRRGGDLPDFMRDGMRYHHERYDGAGYENLKGENIPYIARILAVADVFDALTAKRVYKTSKTMGEALDLMVVKDRHAFDPFILRRFVDMQLRAAAPGDITPEVAAKLTKFAASDPMDDVPPGSDVTIKRNGFRVFWYEDANGERKQERIVHPDGSVKQIAGRQRPEPDLDPQMPDSPSRTTKSGRF